MKSILTFLAVVSVAIAGDIKLPSGRLLRNTQLGPIIYTTGIPSSLAFKYETAVDIKSKKAVCEEVEEVWSAFRVDVEKGKYESAVIMVVGPSTGLFLKSAEQRNFVFEKKGGTWKMGLPSVWEEKNEPNKSPEPTPTAVTPRATEGKSK